MKLCEACGLHPTKSSRATKCASCEVAIAKLENRLAVYRHRMRAKNGKARRNRTYGGMPTDYAVREAIKVLQLKGVLLSP